MPEYKQFPLADTAEGLTEAEILGWRVQPGDEVQVNDLVAEIETAKAAVELPIPWAGVITELLVQPGQTVEVGTPILTIDVDPHGSTAKTTTPAGETASPQPNGAAHTAAAEQDAEQPLVGYGSKTVVPQRRPRHDTPATPAGTAGTTPPRSSGASTAEPSGATAAREPTEPGEHVPLAKPPVRKLAKDLGVDLRTVTGSAEAGVITREDVSRAASGPPDSGEQTADRTRRVPIKGIRKATANAMVTSAFTAPHVTEFLSVDVTPMLQLRERLRAATPFSEVKLTPLAFVAKAVCLAIHRTPDVNAVWDEPAGEIVYQDYVHLGIAAATPRGLVVPKVRDADGLSLLELTREINGRTEQAREGTTPPEDMLGGTFTITNIGVFGIDTGTPIINPGESAILAVGAIREMPWVVDGELAVRSVLQLSLSFDHRVVDGQHGSQFLADVGALLSDPAIAMTF